MELTMEKMFAGLSTLVELLLLALLFSADHPAGRAASGASRQTGARDRVETLTARRGPALASFEACRAGRCPSDGACGPPADQGVRPVCSADARKRCQSIGSDASCPSTKRRTALASPSHRSPESSPANLVALTNTPTVSLAE